MVEIQRKLLRERTLLRQWGKKKTVGLGWGGGGGGGGGGGEKAPAGASTAAAVRKYG